MQRTIPLATLKVRLYVTFYRLSLLVFSVALSTVVPNSYAKADAGNAKTNSRYMSQLTRTFYWAKSVVKYRFTSPEQATNLSQTRLPSIALSEVQKEAARIGMAKWQAALATNPAEAQRKFIEVRPGEAADIEFIVMPQSFFPPNVLGITQSSWRTKPTKWELVCAVVWMREGLTDAQFEYVVLHEQGHALMSIEHSRSSESILFPIVPLCPTKIELSEADASTIRENYRALSSPSG